MQLPAYSIVIPTVGLKGVNLLKRLLPVINYSCRLAHEVVVVDDGSEENVAAELEKVCAINGASMLHDSANRGFSAACNAGINFSNGRVVILCNNDILPIGNTFDALAEYCFFTGAGVVGCKLLYPDDRIQHAGVYYVPPPKGNTNGWFDHLYRFQDRHFIGAERLASMLVTGALIAVNGIMISTIGGMDERFAVAYEDIDYGLRVIEAGAATVYNGYIEAYHLEGYTRGTTPESKAEHPKWAKGETDGSAKFFDKWCGLAFEQFSRRDE